MGLDPKFDRRVAGVKAKHFKQLDDAGAQNTRKNQDAVPTVLIISPMHRRVSLLLDELVQKSGKQLECTGVELYRQALSRLSVDLNKHVVVLVITDQSDDCYAVARGDRPLWQEVIAEYQKNYHASWMKEIGDQVFPMNLTVITYFRTLKGKMDDDAVAKIEEAFEAMQEVLGYQHKSCHSEEEVKSVVDKDVVGMVLQRQQMQNKLKTYTRSRDQKIQRAKKVTKDASSKM